MRRYVSMLALCLLSACATSFQGKPHFEGGRASCQQKCSLQGLEMAGLVYMGEYSSACVCEMPGSHKHAARGATSATTAAAVGVMLQMRAQAAASMLTTMLLVGTITGVGVGAGG